MRADVRPDPLDENPLKTLTEEGGKAQVSQVILRLGVGDFVDWNMVLFLV